LLRVEGRANAVGFLDAIFWSWGAPHHRAASCTGPQRQQAAAVHGTRAHSL